MIINLKTQTELSGFYIIYEGSTHLEKKGWYGIAHLMEHLVCKAFDDYQEELDRDGVEWNAYTSNNEIVFYIKGLDEKINKWKYKLIDALSEFNVTKKDFEKEKMIVLEEYMDSFNDQSQSHYLNLHRKLFNEYSPIGLRKDLENMQYMDCLNFWELQYSNPSKIINVSKNNEYKNNTISFSNNDINKDLTYGNHKVDLELNNQYKGKTSIMMLTPIIKEDFATIDFINSMLSLGLRSPLYQEIREKRGLAYFVHCYQNRIGNQSLSTISTQTSDKNVDAVIDATKKIISNPNKYLTQERLELVRDYYKVRKKKSDILRHSNVNKWIEPDGWSVYDILDKVNLSNIKSVYNKYYNFDNLYISQDIKEFN